MKVKTGAGKFLHTYFPATLAILSFTPIKFLVIIGIILLWSYALSRKLSIYISTVIAVALYFSVNTTIAGLAYLFGFALPVELILLLQIGVFLLIRSTLLNNLEAQKTNPQSYVASVAGLVLLASIFIVLMLPIIRAEKHEIYKTVTFGGDNTSHIELIKAVVDRGGYFYEEPLSSGYVITENLAGYPQGFHFNAFVLVDTLKPIVDVTRSYERLLVFYYAYSLALFLLLAGSFIAIIQTILPKKKVLFAGISVAGVLFTGILFSLFALGFQTQIASLVLLLTLLSLLHLASETKDSAVSKAYFILALFALAGISFTWLFLFPVAAAISGLYFLTRYTKEVIRKPRKNLWFLLGVFLLGLVSLLQPFIQLMFQSTKTSGVNEIGFTVIPSSAVVASLVIIALASIPMILKRSRDLWLITFLVSGFFSVYVYVYQWSHIGEARYYFHKSLFTLIILSSVLLVVMVTRLVADSPLGNERQKNLLFLSILFVGLLFAAHNLTNKNDYFQKQKGGGFSAEIAVTAGRIVEADDTNGKKIIAVGSCNRAHDYTASRLFGTLTGDHDIIRQGLISALLVPDRVSLIRAIKTYQETKSPELIIISSDYGLQKQLEQELNDAYGKETYIDLDFGHQAKTVEQCPNLVR